MAEPRRGRIENRCPSTEEWIKNVVLIYKGIVLSHKKEQNCVICRDVDGPRKYHIE